MNDAKLYKEAMQVLKDTSRTFYIPITLLGKTLKHTVGSAYLGMRAIDEIEDHETMDPEVKQQLLRTTSELLKKPFDRKAYEQLVAPYDDILPEVTLRLADWILVCPEGIRERVQEYTSIMAAGMADWVERDWLIESREDLDDYTYCVAGSVGEMLAEIWDWYDGTKTSPEYAIGYGRGLQAVNILRNQDEDYDERGVRFVPTGWTRDDVFAYAEENLKLGDAYLEGLTSHRIRIFSKIPLALAKKSLEVMQSGKEKMTRQEVEEVVEKVKNE